jgi:acetolactate synthase-1/2/3 large subunit
MEGGAGVGLGTTLSTEEVVGDQIAAWLDAFGVRVVFGVISIHNMPILDAIARQGKIRFVPARGEAGAMSMADAYARVSRSLGVVITSTGTAAGNAAGSQVEALTACSPVLHITTQIDRPFADRDRAAIHDVPRQPDMLRALSKAVFRVWEPRTAIGMLAAAAGAALASPTGPVSIEFPIDVQRVKTPKPILWPLPGRQQILPDLAAMDTLAAARRAARRPMLWLGGGARGATEAATDLVARGFCAVTSTNGRGTVPEDHVRSLGAFNMTPEAQAIYDRCDLMIVVGSRLRGNETRNNEMRLPHPLVQIDADAAQASRNYDADLFIHGEAGPTLAALLERLPQKLDVDTAFAHDVTIARAKGEGTLRTTLGPYQVVADALLARVGPGHHPFVRDVTIANSTFGNRYVQLGAPHLGVHALGGGIGQGVAMAIGASMASPGKKTVCLVGDGGAMVNLGEWASAVEEAADVVFLLMNDRGYGVIRNIQDAQYGGRHHYLLKVHPDFGQLAGSLGLPHRRVAHADDFTAAFDSALATPGPIMLELDMISIGPFAQAFGGPPAGAAGKAVA